MISLTVYSIYSYNYNITNCFYKGGDIINRQTIYELADPCLDEQSSIVRIFNTVPGIQPLDVYADDIPRMGNIEYKEITNYIPARPGPEIIKVYSSQGHNLLLQVDTSIIPGQIMTQVIWGSLNTLKLLPIIDDINQDIRPDQTKFRFYNLGASSAIFTLTSPKSSTSTTLASGNGSSYNEISPGVYKLEVRSTNPVNTTLTLKPGRIYTIYILSSVSPDSKDYAQTNIPQVILVVDGNTLFDKCIWYW
jgi:hypothetical protein